MQKFRQVSGGNCQLVLYRESKPGVPDPADAGVVLALYSESMAVDANKQGSAVITNARGQGKPVPGTPNYTGGLEVPPYAPQMGHILRALCGAPATTRETAAELAQEEVTNEGLGYVGLPVTAHKFVQDTVVTITGTANYDGAYRLEYGTTDKKLVIKALYRAETIASGARAHRGRGAFLDGAAEDLGDGKVALPVGGFGVALHEGESVTVAGTANYDGAHVLQKGTGARVLVIETAYAAESFDGTPTAIPAFFRHEFSLPRNQPTFCIQKKFDFEAGAGVNPYTVILSNKLNGLSFSFGGETEIKISLDCSVGSVENISTPVNPSQPSVLPGIPFWDKETAVWVNSRRAGDVQKGSLNLAFGIDGQVAVGDMGKRSRQPEGDPTGTLTLTVFLEHDEYQQLADMAATVPVAVSMSGANGEELWLSLPESELDTGGPQISGKGGLTIEVKAIGFVDLAQTSSQYTLINRVGSYA